MKTYHHNGEQWYMDVMPIWVRVLRWLVWLGGWEHIVHDEDGYRVRLRPRHAMGLSIRSREAPKAWAIYCSLCPLGLFGHKIVFNVFGFHLSTRRGYWCVTWPHGWPHPAARGRQWKIYYSPNATPSCATIWLLGAPDDVRDAAEDTAERAADRAR